MTGDMARILIVDDIDDNRYTLRRRLSRQGYEHVDEAENGRVALERLASEAYDLVLLDIMMPEMDGYQVLETLEAQGRIGDPPIIMISALDEMDSIVRCIKLGAEDYLPKPFNATLLKARIGAVLHKKKLRDAVRESRDRMQKELDAARRLQLGMVPTVFPAPTPESPVEVHASMEPAREVGGDLYDVFFPSPGLLCLVIGDVSDKGTPAALYMARTRSVVRLCVTMLAEAGSVSPDPAAVLNAVNRELCQNNSERMFVTLWLGLLNVATGELRFANAGHPPPLCLSAGEIMRLAVSPRPPIGATSRAVFETATLALSPGDTLYAFTDGVTDATDPGGEFFGEGRVLETLASVAGLAPVEIDGRICAALAAHMDGTPPFDDVTMLCLRWRP